MQLNDREKNIVNLINQLSEYANDEETTQAEINNILSKIVSEKESNIKDEMNKVSEYDSRPKVEFPSDKMSESISQSIELQKKKMMEELMGNKELPINETNTQGRMLFTRIREVKKPGKAHPTDAGIDFYVPDWKAWDKEFKDMIIKYSCNFDPNDIEFTDKGLVVNPNAHVAIPSGIKTIIPQGLGMMFVNKSGIATKLKLDHSACLVDSEYRDEIVMCFFNHNTEPVTIEPGMKITQGLIVPIINLEMNEVLNCVYEDMGKDTDRGGGFGSSGIK